MQLVRPPSGAHCVERPADSKEEDHGSSQEYRGTNRSMHRRDWRRQHEAQPDEHVRQNVVAPEWASEEAIAWTLELHNGMSLSDGSGASATFDRK